MGRRPKYEDITDKWMHDPKWKNQQPFMIGDFLCYEVVKGSGRDATFEHFMYDTKGKTFNNMVCDGVPMGVITYYFDWFYKE